MSKIKLNNSISIDLPKLIESRLLIQANSGGGKSWAIRRVIEQAFGKVQIIVLDPEGEFTNLREKYDFVFAGKGGDAPAEPRSAGLLARRLLELRASAIVDLYEMHPSERKHFVRVFLDTMVNAPKELWHDCLVILDEAHNFAPEKGEAESMGAVIDLATRGRKRGYCAILATQRLPKLHKDASAECNNKLIGRASQDIDRKRAAEELGFTTGEQVRSLRDLEPGEFYVFGPAVSRDVQKTMIGDVQVKPPKRGQAALAPPPPTEKVRSILGKLADLPKEAETEARTIAEFKKENANLRREITLAKRTNPAAPAVKIERIEVPAVGKRALEGLKKSEASMRKLLFGLQKANAINSGLVESVEVAIGSFAAAVKSAVEEMKQKHTEIVPRVHSAFSLPKLPVKNYYPKNTMLKVEGEITNPEQRILDAIAWMESIGINEPEQTAVAFLADYRYGGGAFNNPRGALRTKGLVEYRGNNIALTEEGRLVANAPETPLTTEELHKRVLGRLETPHRKLLVPLLEAYPESITNEELAERSGYTFGSGGFNNPKGRLRSLSLIEYLNGGRVRARDLLFLD